MSAESRQQIMRDLEERKKMTADFKSQRSNLPKRPSIVLISKYANYILKSGLTLGQFMTRWISIFSSFDKITNFYNQNMNEVINSKIAKLRCPAFYKNREVLIRENSYFDLNSFTFILLDWVFYFFSPEFSECFTNEENYSPKILSILSALIFILLNEPDANGMFLSREQLFDQWMTKLEKPLHCCHNIFHEIYDKVKGLNVSVDMTEANFREKIFKEHKLGFLRKYEEILKQYLSILYEKGFSTAE